MWYMQMPFKCAASVQNLFSLFGTMSNFQVNVINLFGKCEHDKTNKKNRTEN